MKTFFVALLLLVSAVCTNSTAQVYTCKSGTVSFFSKTPLRNIDATSTNVNCITNIATREVAMIIPIRGFKFKDDMMEEHFNEKYMESDKYPNATYNGKINQDFDLTKDGTYPITTTGKLIMHGVENEVTEPGTIIVSGNDITVISAFNIAVKDYKIKIPKLVFEEIADTVAVKMNINLQPYKSPSK